MHKRTFGRPAFHHVELRIGNVDMSGSSEGVHFGNGNPLVGFYDGPDVVNSSTYKLEPAVSGQYLTLQTIQHDHLLIDEIQVFRF